MRPVVLGSGVALPEHSFSQSDVYEGLIAPLLGHDPRFERILRNSRVERRHSVLSSLEYHRTPRTTAERNGVWVREGRELVVRAARACLEDAGLTPQEVDEVITVSCTGIDTPGPDLWLAESLGMRADLRRAHIGGMGCYAGLPALYRACSTVRAQPELKILVASVELCTLHFQREATAENVVVSSLFGDGAAAVLVGSARSAADHPAFDRFVTWTDTARIDQMGFHLTDHGLQMRLSTEVPPAVEEMLPRAIERLLEGTGLSTGEIRTWLVHPGGVRILDAAERSLGLGPESLARSRALLAGSGNLSSATSLVLLDAHRREMPEGDTGPGVLLSFGPGLSIEAALFVRTGGAHLR
jgi:predicted naringenin-chalcone synthase